MDQQKAYTEQRTKKLVTGSVGKKKNRKVNAVNGIRKTRNKHIIKNKKQSTRANKHPDAKPSLLNIFLPLPSPCMLVSKHLIPAEFGLLNSPTLHLKMQKHQQQSKLKPCVNSKCCFYGSPSTLNLCPFCYKEHQILQLQAKLKQFISTCKKRRLAAESSCNPSSSDKTGYKDASAEDIDDDHGHAKKVVLRCYSCNKRLTICSIFRCRCGEQFCSLHRYSEQHHCSFDYKSAGQEAIAKANPVVKADKLHHRI